MINIHNLAGRIANLYYDYDYYDFNDSLEVGETMEDAIFKIERVLSGKGGADRYIDFMDEIIDNIEWERAEDPSDPDYGEDMLKRAKRIRNDLYNLKDGRRNIKESCRRRVNEDTEKTIFKNDEYIIKQSPISVRVLRYKTKILDGVPDTDYHFVLEVNKFGAYDSLGRSYTLRAGDDPISFAKRWIGVKDIR